MDQMHFTKTECKMAVDPFINVPVTFFVAQDSNKCSNEFDINESLGALDNNASKSLLASSSLFVNGCWGRALVSFETCSRSFSNCVLLRDRSDEISFS
jgi:hypothetical protein